MPIAFKPEETFRNDFHYGNSPEAIRRFPFPFTEDTYMYSVNIEPHKAGPKDTCYEFPIDIESITSQNAVSVPFALRPHRVGIWLCRT